MMSFAEAASAAAAAAVVVVNSLRSGTMSSVPPGRAIKEERERERE